MKSALEDQYNIDYFIIDNSPGDNLFTTELLNEIDCNLFITKVKNNDLLGVVNMIANLNFNSDSRCAIIANQIPKELLNKEFHQNLQEVIEKDINKRKNYLKVIFRGLIGISYGIQRIEINKALQSVKETTNAFNGLSNIVVEIFSNPLLKTLEVSSLP